MTNLSSFTNQSMIGPKIEVPNPTFMSSYGACDSYPSWFRQGTWKFHHGQKGPSENRVLELYEKTAELQTCGRAGNLLDILTMHCEGHLTDLHLLSDCSGDCRSRPGNLVNSCCEMLWVLPVIATCERSEDMAGDFVRQRFAPDKHFNFLQCFRSRPPVWVYGINDHLDIPSELPAELLGVSSWDVVYFAQARQRVNQAERGKQHGKKTRQNGKMYAFLRPSCVFKRQMFWPLTIVKMERRP